MTSANTTSVGGLLSQSNLADHLALSIRRDKHGSELKRVPIPSAFVRDFKHELLFEFACRRGMPDATLQDISVQTTPVHANEGTRSFCRGLRVEITNPRGETFQREYNVYLFSDVASVAAAQLVAGGVLKLHDSYHYELVVDENVASAGRQEQTGILFGSEPKQAPLQYLTRPLRQLLEQARPVGEPSNEHFPVVYTAEAYERAERFARRGAEAHPPRETGAALVGTPCSCPDSGEFFFVIADALEATDAEEASASLSYTGKTWLRLQAILKSIQAQPATRTYRILGQAHGHNFIPGDACEQCDKVKVCDRTSVFVSIDDRTWTQAVFSGAPYALCHIFGFNARRDEVQGLYSLRDNRLTQRGFYIIPEFDPTHET